MNIITLGISHKTAPIQIRERLSFSDLNIKNAYALIKNYSALKEFYILSTCNRVELYAAGENHDQMLDSLKDFLYSFHEISKGSMDQYLYHKTEDQAMRHLIRVASGLDSLIVGENQILGQVKRAYEEAVQANTVGSFMHKLIQEAIRIGKKVRSETEISKGVTSLPGAAVELIKQLPSTRDKRILVIGAGKIGAITVNKLEKTDLKEIVLINRSLTKSQYLKTTKVRIEKFENLESEMANADIIISATAALSPIITKNMVKNILSKNPKGLLMIDMGVPRNIEEAADELQGVRLYNVDDLGLIVDETIRNRRIEAIRAVGILNTHMTVDLKIR